jgi:alpha-N-arabinofuranosidase
MDELIARHSTIMDKYDPEKRVGMMVDEWGTWYDVEPGTNPRFLYQQNSLRDALVAGLTLNIFHKHCDRVRMANLAQTVNVLQAMVLTQGADLVLTPTYHVFEMYAVHQDATLLPCELDCQSLPTASDGDTPVLSASASRDSEGAIHVSLCNLHASSSATLRCEVRGIKMAAISGRVLTADVITAHNTFAEPQRVVPAAYDGAELTEDGFAATLPARSVVVLSIQAASGA